MLLICDEVATGFGRTGTLFACEQEGVVPDFLCLAKGLTGGYLPLAATLTTDAVYESFLGPFESKRTFFHGHSYTGNPLACAAALASLRLFDEMGTLEHANNMAARLAEGLQAVGELPHVGDVRQRGLMIGIELVKDKKTREEYGYGDRMGHKVCAGRAQARADAAAAGERHRAGAAPLDRALGDRFPRRRRARGHRGDHAVKGFFVAGTDTGVGKTQIARALCAALARKGCGPWR